jgi:UDP-glucose:(heptosyl)LPS alpha-1,3-glucosyltransferase
MRLAVVCRPLGALGGVETATAGLVAELVRRGHAIDLLSTRRQQDLAGVRVRRLPVLEQPSILRVLSFALAARRAAARGSYDIVQSHERGLSQDIYRAGEGTHRGYLLAMGRARPRVGSYHHIVCRLEKGIFERRRARHIVAISRAGKAEIERVYGTPAAAVSLIYNGVDLQRFHPDNRSRWGSAARDALGMDSAAWVVLFVGSGFERKGLGPLLLAVGRIRDPQCRLVVAGKGDARPYRELARRLGIEPRVLWLGQRRDVEHLYAAADVVALPALYEPFGNVHLEALASGVPVLTSARAGGSEVVTAGRTGWVVSEPTGDAIAEGLVALRQGHRAALGAAARQVAEAFTFAAEADAFESVYRRLEH